MAKRRVSPAAGESEPKRDEQRTLTEQIEAAESDAVLRSRIAARAYALFLARGSQHGDDWADWFQAEREVLAEERPAPDPEGP